MTSPTSKVRLAYLRRRDGFYIYETDRQYRNEREHPQCMDAKVWDWPRYKGGACELCEETFSKLWQDHIAGLHKDTASYMAHVGIGKRHHSCTIENFEGSEAVKQACRAIAKNPSDLVLTGSPGTGKSHLAAAIVRELILAGKIFRVTDPLRSVAEFITAANLFLDLRKSFNDREADTETVIIERLSKITLLVLDDLGSEKPSEWAITTLYTIIDARYREMRPTIVTTNLSLKQIAGQLHERIASRLSSGNIVKLSGPDHRVKRGEP